VGYRWWFALVLQKVLLAENRLSIEQLGSDDCVSELFEELGIVGAFDRGSYSFLRGLCQRDGTAQGSLRTHIPNTCCAESLFVLPEMCLIVGTAAALYGNAS
jgi:hypothetical protein